MEYQKENIKTLKVVSKANQSHNYDWDIIVPDSKPDIENIISTDGTVCILSKEIMQDRAILNGSVKINILYISSEDSKCVKNIESIQNFNCVLELQNLRQNMTLNIYSFISKISSDLINSRKINVSSLIDFHGTVYDAEEVSYISKIEDEKIKYKTKEIKTLNMISCFEKSVSFNENIEVPTGKASMSEILKLKPTFTSKEIKNIKNKFLLRGNIGLSTVYLCDTDSEIIQHMTHEIPINEIMDCENLSENSIFDYDIEIQNFNYILKENADGEKRIIKVCGDIILKCKIFEEVFFNPVTDMYGLENNVKLEKNLFIYDEILSELSGQISIKGTVEFKDIKDVQKVLLFETNNEVNNILNNGDFITVKGTTFVNMLYISMDGEMCFAKSSMPFEHSINSSESSSDILYDLKIENESFSYNILTSTEFELRVNLNYKLRIKKNISQEIVEKAEVDGLINDRLKTGLIVCFCDGNESLWEIAKKYRTSIEDIILANDLKEDLCINKGMKLIIP